MHSPNPLHTSTYADSRHQHQVCGKYCLRTLRSVSHCSSYRHQRWYREPHLVIPHTRPRGVPPNIPTSWHVHTYASPTTPDDPICTYDSDSKVILVDNCCTASITNDMNDFIVPPDLPGPRLRGTMVSLRQHKWVQLSGK
jgi:hypothetical protein